MGKRCFAHAGAVHGHACTDFCEHAHGSAGCRLGDVGHGCALHKREVDGFAESAREFVEDRLQVIADLRGRLRAQADEGRSQGVAFVGELSHVAAGGQGRQNAVDRRGRKTQLLCDVDGAGSPAHGAERLEDIEGAVD